MTEPSILFWGFIIRTTALLQADFHKSLFSHKLKGKKKAFWKPVTYFIVWFLTTGPAARPKGRVTSDHGLLPGDYFILLHYFIVSWVWVVLLASLCSALLRIMTLNSVQTGIAARPVHTGTDCLNHTSSPQMQLHVPKGPTWGTPALATLSS